MIHFDRLYYFQRIARNGSIRKASEELFVSESALSKSLRLLEQEMGCTLFHRHGKRLQLNDDGVFLLHLVDDLIAQAENLKPKLDKHRGICGQIVMDTFFDFPADIMLHDVLEAHYPDVPFVWKNAVRSPMEQLQDLAKGATDIAVIPISLDELQKMMPKFTKSGIHSMFLLMEHLYLSAPWGADLDQVETMSVLDTRTERLVRAGGSSNYAAVWYEEILAAKRQAPAYHYDIDTFTFLKDWENCATPFITTSLYMARKDYASGFSKRHQIRLSDSEAERGIFLFYRRAHSPILDLFTTLFKQRFYEMFLGEEMDSY